MDATIPRSAPRLEFIVLVALTTSLVAMSIDTMLPALGTMATDLGVLRENDRQLVLSAFFAGMTPGLLFYGPVSDVVGRRRALFFGLGLFVFGNLICASTGSFSWLLVGRALSGFGAASPRVVSMALVRDLYSGRAMARVMSFVSMVFILVPVVAPGVGQAILSLAGWRTIFAALVVMAVLDLGWFALRQPETLSAERRARFSPSTLAASALETFRHPLTLGYMLGTGVVFGAFFNYLSTAQQIFQEQYSTGTLFPLYFGILASAIGLASFANAKLVMRFGMRRLSRTALLTTSGCSVSALGIAALWHGHPPLALLMAYLFVAFFCNGVLFGNFNARAMQPMGHIAGVAAAVMGCVGTFVSLAIGTAFGRAYDGTVLPLIAAFTTCGLLALALTAWAERAAEARAASRGVADSDADDSVGVADVARDASSAGVAVNQDSLQSR